MTAPTERPKEGTISQAFEDHETQVLKGLKRSLTDYEKNILDDMKRVLAEQKENLKKELLGLMYKEIKKE